MLFFYHKFNLKSEKCIYYNHIQIHIHVQVHVHTLFEIRKHKNEYNFEKLFVNFFLLFLGLKKSKLDTPIL